MSNFLSDIADFSGNHSTPKDITLSANPNFLQWGGKKTEVDVEKQAIKYNKKTVVELTILRAGLIKKGFFTPLMNISAFNIRDNTTGTVYTFRGNKTSANTVEGNIFQYYVNSIESSVHDTVSSLSQVFSLHPFFNTKFEIVADYNTLRLISKNWNESFDLELIKYDSRFIKMDTSYIVETENEKFTIKDTNTLDFSLRMLSVEQKKDEKLSFAFTLNGKEYSFTPTENKSEIDGKRFFYNKDNLSVSAENLRRSMNANSILKANFDISILPFVSESGLKAGSTIRFRSLNDKDLYSFKLNKSDFVEITSHIPVLQQHDAFMSNSTETEIQLEFFTNTGVFLGEHRLPQHIDQMGTYVTTQSKAYIGDPVWFDLNSVARNYRPFASDVLTKAGWVDTGTLVDYRILGKRYDKQNTETFYVSDVMYAINGYKRNLEENDIDEYVYSIDAPTTKVKLLTTQPQLMHVKGQKQYLNFILSDSQHTNDDVKYGKTIGVMYCIYSQAGSFLRKVIKHGEGSKKMNIANSICLEIDDLLTDEVGRVEVYLCCNEEVVSEPLVFTILPEYWYEVNDFAFLNSLGGWSSFNFPGTDQTEFKAKANVFTKTQTPDFSIKSEIESVFSRNVEEQFIVQTMPINRVTADWLREMSASPVVYHVQNGLNRYVVVDDLTVKHNSKDELFVLQMKYHYSDVYNAG